MTDAALRAGLEKKMSYSFDNQTLFERALTHRSASAMHMERLEFLGDAVLGLVIAEHLHARFPDRREGHLTRMRAALVCRDALLRVAGKWKLVSLLHVAEGERSATGVKSPSIAANAVEALIGAVFEDGGWQSARYVVLAAWQDMLRDIDQVDVCDAKSRLQEFTQSKGWGLPNYRLEDLGAGTFPRFKAECRVNGELAGEGEGGRKKLAEIRAAEQACKQLNI